MALEVAAAVIGILAAAGKVAETLAPVISAYRDSAQNAVTILSEIDNVRFTLVSLHGLFENISEAPQKRRKLIQVDQLIVSLTNGVLLFSELEALVLQLGCPPSATSARVKWAWKDKEMTSLVSRLQRFQISMSLMLNILQCISDVEAHNNRQELLSISAALLESNHELTRRISHLEVEFQTIAGSSKSLHRPGSILTAETNVSLSANKALQDLKKGIASLPVKGTVRNAQYETVLEASRVYRKVRRATSILSFRSSVAPTHAWTALSDISLSDISIVSVVGLPLTREEINNQHHYSFLEHPNQPSSNIPAPIVNPKAPIDAPCKIRIIVRGTKEAEINELIARFKGPPCIPGRDDSIINRYEKLWDVDGVALLLEIQAITDVHGIDTDRHMRNGQNYMLVYSSQSRDSHYRMWKDHLRIQKWKGNDFNTIIRVSNHFDPEEPGLHQHEEVGLEYNKSGIRYCHVSETDPLSISVPFRALVRAQLKHEDALVKQSVRQRRRSRRKLPAGNLSGVIEED